MQYNDVGFLSAGARVSVHEPLGEVLDWLPTDDNTQAAARRSTRDRAQAASGTEQTSALRGRRVVGYDTIESRSRHNYM